MLRLREVILTEGRYDKAKLAGLVDSPVLAVGGFAALGRPGYLAMLRRVASSVGAVILTDPDPAGERLRASLAANLAPGTYRHAVLPKITGRCRRKGSRAGVLGVENAPLAVIEEALRGTGLPLDCPAPDDPVDGAFLYEAGLSGGENSAAARRALLTRLGLPDYLSAREAALVLGALYTKEELTAALRAPGGR